MKLFQQLWLNLTLIPTNDDMDLTQLPEKIAVLETANPENNFTKPAALTNIINLVDYYKAKKINYIVN